MGYFKNKLIEQQVELGDRQPKPAADHVALQRPELDLTSYKDRRAGSASWFGFLLIGFSIGFGAGIIVGVFS